MRLSTLYTPRRLSVSHWATCITLPLIVVLCCLYIRFKGTLLASCIYVYTYVYVYTYISIYMLLQERYQCLRLVRVARQASPRPEEVPPQAAGLYV